MKMGAEDGIRDHCVTGVQTCALPISQFQTPEEIKKQRKIHDKLIEKGLQLIADSFLDQLGARCDAAGVGLTRQLLEGINYEEIVNEVNRSEERRVGKECR